MQIVTYFDDIIIFQNEYFADMKLTYESVDPLGTRNSLVLYTGVRCLSNHVLH